MRTMITLIAGKQFNLFFPLLLALIRGAQCCFPRQETPSDDLRFIYRNHILPLEQHFLYHEFYSVPMDDGDFEGKPMVLFIGEYSTGKTSMIRYLTGSDYDGMRISPEPTTDKFIVLYNRLDNCYLEGNTLSLDNRRPFQTLRIFGTAFLNQFRCTSMDSEILKTVTLIDTPGILAGEKQRLARGYDFPKVLEWFSSRVDRIILMFDAHKLDISDEYSESIKALRGQEDKIRIVLNKADTVSSNELLRMNGALYWSLSKIFTTPEVPRVYIGSFWNKKNLNHDDIELFEEEEKELISDLKSLAIGSISRKLNSLIKRVRLVKVHAHIIDELVAAYNKPWFFGSSNKDELIDNLNEIYKKIQMERNISSGDFPVLRLLQNKLRNSNFDHFRPMLSDLRNKMEKIDSYLAQDIGQLLKKIQSTNTDTRSKEL